jgi:hypothetical protein
LLSASRRSKATLPTSRGIREPVLLQNDRHPLLCSYFVLSN